MIWAKKAYRRIPIPPPPLPLPTLSDFVSIDFFLKNCDLDSAASPETLGSPGSPDIEDCSCGSSPTSPGSGYNSNQVGVKARVYTLYINTFYIRRRQGGYKKDGEDT